MDQLVPELYGYAEEGKAKKERRDGRRRVGGGQEEGRRARARASTLAFDVPNHSNASLSQRMAARQSFHQGSISGSLHRFLRLATCGLLTRSCHGQGWGRAFNDNESFSKENGKNRSVGIVHRSYSIDMYSTCTASYPTTVRQCSSEVGSQVGFALLITSGIGINRVAAFRSLTTSPIIHPPVSTDDRIPFAPSVCEIPVPFVQNGENVDHWALNGHLTLRR